MVRSRGPRDPGGGLGVLDGGGADGRSPALQGACGDPTRIWRVPLRRRRPRAKALSLVRVRLSLVPGRRGRDGDLRGLPAISLAERPGAMAAGVRPATPSRTTACRALPGGYGGLVRTGSGGFQTRGPEAFGGGKDAGPSRPPSGWGDVLGPMGPAARSRASARGSDHLGVCGSGARAADTGPWPQSGALRHSHQEAGMCTLATWQVPCRTFYFFFKFHSLAATST